MKRKLPEYHHHGPENAEHEIKKAFSETIETELVYSKRQSPSSGVDSEEVSNLYRRAFRAFRDKDRLAAERWARTVKHLARALRHEAKISYFEPRSTKLPFLENAFEEYGTKGRDTVSTTEDLLESVAHHIPPGLTEMPEEMRRYLLRARKHLEVLKESAKESTPVHELLHAEHLLAAHEYGRVLECLALAYEAASQKSKPEEAA